MVRDYEVMYIVRPDLDDEGLAAAMQTVETTIDGQGGEVVRTTPWGKRRLAYEIDRMRDGNYVLLHVRLDGARVKEVERLLQINENVVRHLVTLWVDTRGKDEAEEGEAGGQDGAAVAPAVRAAAAATEAEATEDAPDGDAGDAADAGAEGDDEVDDEADEEVEDELDGDDAPDGTSAAEEDAGETEDEEDE